MAGLIQGVVKGVSAGIGLAVEKRHDHKERKNALANPTRPTHHSATSSPRTSNANSNLRDYVSTTDVSPPDYESSEAIHRRYEPNTAELAEASPTDPHSASRLPGEQQQLLQYPIVIPQRRPGTKTRGFARAYPPDLESFGIEEAAFLKFLDDLHAAGQGSPWLRAIQVSAAIAGFAPSVTAMAVAAGVGAAASSAIEVQGRYKTNAYLDRMNKEVFTPLGLFAMIIIYNPDTTGSDNSRAPVLGIEDVNMDTAKHITRRLTHSDQGMSRKKHHALRTASGETNGEASMPIEVAPLVYPSSSAPASPSPNEESFKERVSRNASFVQDYFDRRTQAEYIHKNPDTVLARSQTAPQFRSKFGDPNHPSNSGDLVSLVSGGALSGLRSRGQYDGGLGMLRQRLDERRSGGLIGGLGGRAAGGPLGILHGSVKKVMQKNVLYLTIVNLPSDEELARARQTLQAEGGLRNLSGR
ncbi:hypothetical protein BDV96DRAFT_572810 [Lophiotrema nucula]|uniref:Uncharacterized protein n=1 Tax=Lophiotrema nucula TaxID=690887 RepID=A0A6A5ZCH7_9PLEO|nr:hypothetical protein BDV96DRAFT_572810 [Lophiotrema nucula]